jgi:hypothetical protein
MLCIIICAGNLHLDIALNTFFEVVVTASKNEGAKRGDMAQVNRGVESALLDMDAWIGKGN